MRCAPSDPSRGMRSAADGWDSVLILILGDCHGRLDLVRRACEEAQVLWDIGAAIQVGDFGYFPSTIIRYLSSDN